MSYSNLDTQVYNESEENERKHVQKRSHEDEQDTPQKVCCTTRHTTVVAAHYNQITEKGRRDRKNSPIFYLRNFNNWVKSVLIQRTVTEIRNKDYGRYIKVLDMCCGKGGDLSKWQKSRIGHVVLADIAEVSVEQCKARYDDLQGPKFKAEFIAADCTKETLREKYKDPSIRFDIVSCQFGLHYSFESYMQVRKMLKNITECLKPGGFFFGTTTNAHEIVSRVKKSPTGEFGNRVYNIKLLFDYKDGYPLFGAKYDFHLEGVVDCPEFLVNFDLFVKLAREFDLELVYREGFANFYRDHIKDYKNLLHKINCLESYPAPSGKQLMGEEPDYEHAKTYLDNLDAKTESIRIGTMSKSEWEVATVYLAFIFKKLKK